MPYLDNLTKHDLYMDGTTSEKHIISYSNTEDIEIIKEGCCVFTTHGHLLEFIFGVIAGNRSHNNRSGMAINIYHHFENSLDINESFIVLEILIVESDGLWVKADTNNIKYRTDFVRHLEKFNSKDDVGLIKNNYGDFYEPFIKMFERLGEKYRDERSEKVFSILENHSFNDEKYDILISSDKLKFGFVNDKFHIIST